MLAALGLLLSQTDKLREQFLNPPSTARPDVYWYFMEGNLTREGMTADLESMRKQGLGGGIYLEVNIGVPKGPVRYMSPDWLDLVGFGVHEAERLGLEIEMATGPGWCGTGGPWVKPEQAMQHLVSAETTVQGPAEYHAVLPKPKPRTPFFGMGSLTPELTKQWQEFYRDEAVVAFKTPDQPATIKDLDAKSLVYRPSFSSMAGTPSYLRPDTPEASAGSTVPSTGVIDLTSHLQPDGTLTWHAPEGKWTVVRFGRTLTGQTTRPAPDAGLGFETDKFEREGIADHLNDYLEPIVKRTGPNHSPGKGLTALHFDSWEMGSQNWSAHFRAEFKKLRGYDPLPFLPVMAGKIVDSVQISERFLWDLRQAAQELVVTNHLGTIKNRGKRYGLGVTLEPYDLNPTSDLVLGETADLSMGEFWSSGHGYRTEYSCTEAVSVGHTCGKPIIGAESFTADETDTWLQNPSSMKAQTDWAFATGINKIYFHRYQHQPKLDEFPGMTMGPYGVHWERTETWWDLVKPYHEYIARCQQMLRQGLPVADVLYLVPEGAPNVFVAPIGSTVGDLPDRRGYNFDACSPERLMEAAKVEDGKIVFPDGMSYRLLVLPEVDSMTPRLLSKLKDLVEAGANVVGTLPSHSPSLTGYPSCDDKIKTLARSFATSSAKGRLLPVQVAGDLTLDPAKTKWIWTDECDPTIAAPVGARTFRRKFTLDPNAKPTSAIAAFLGDNSYQIYLNGRLLSTGRDFHNLSLADALTYLNPGPNEIVANVVNEGVAPNPAGLLGALELGFQDGSKQEISTDRTWTSDGHSVKELGGFGIGPWNVPSSSLNVLSMYPSYEQTAQVLRNDLKLDPDVSCDDRLRYAHRTLAGKDLYFLANRSESRFDGVVKLRVATGYPEWWDPKTGQGRPLPTFEQVGGITSIPLRLEGLESGFVVFQGSQLPVNGPNFSDLETVQKLDGHWTITFDPRSSGLAQPIAGDLFDWSKSSDDHVKYFSGKATYAKNFDAPSAGSIPFQLSLGDVKNLARVVLNGTDLGVAWCAPYTIEIPAGLLKPTGNSIQIEVANLWPNRLIGDAGLPQEKRVTKTNWNPFSSDSPLLPSGLLGPVEIKRQIVK